MSRSVVFNESVMFNDSLSSDHDPDNSEKELQRMSVQVEHVDDEIGVQVEPVDDQDIDVADDDAHDVVQQTPPEEDFPIPHANQRGVVDL